MKKYGCIGKKLTHSFSKEIHALLSDYDYELCELTGEELDVFLIGINEPVSTYSGRIIGIAYRADDVEDKLVMAPVGRSFSAEEILSAVYFQEKYYKTTVAAFDGGRALVSAQE